ncbi:MAG: hypothetical protein EZS28_021348 [Streblomastix strix]|uniref:Uncharacterized protein n=1 Tax=Streblomastix strix TaxID=222440 RepID=A0A5J4VKU6_9EUKA|nr:MAG: hypothetical protein EZS28_021348 [Streblomastix strix]
MLLLVLALTSLSKTFVIKFEKFNLVDTTLIWDERDGYFEVETDGLNPWGVSIDSANFSLLPERITSLDDFVFRDVPSHDDSCSFINQYYNVRYFEFWGTIALSYYNISVKPSVLHFLNCHPRQYQEIDSQGEVADNLDLTPLCRNHPGSYPDLRGMVDETCYGTSDDVEAECRTTCVDGTPIKVFGKDLLHTFLQQGGYAEDYLKQLLVSFGPVLAYRYQKDEYEVYYGWQTIGGNVEYLSLTRSSDDNLQFTTTPSSSFRNIDEFDVFYGTRIDLSDEDPSKPPFDCATDVTEETSLEQCECLPIGDPRAECETPSTVDCTKTPTDPSCPPVDAPQSIIDCSKTPDNAACSGECKDNTKKTITECACVVGDKRDACKEIGKDASDTTRVFLSVVAAAVAIPMLALFW